jgi:aldehyde:ferredoxin oxidoreductase
VISVANVFRCASQEHCIGNEEMNGYGGNILRINLTEKKIIRGDLDPELARQWIGGRGFIAKLLFDELPERIDALSAENRLVIATGPLSGTFWPSAAKIVCGAKSPLTGGYADSNMGGFIMAELKFAGYDMIIFEGVSKDPVYLYVNDEIAELRDARVHWGKGALDAERDLKADLGEAFQIATIGPAGENMVRYANINHDFGRQAGRGGMGAVMGSKRLKAVAVRGTKSIPIHNPDELVAITKSTIEFIKRQPNLQRFRLYGTTDLIEWCQGLGLLPTKNFISGQFQKVKGLNPELMRKEITIRDKACFACPLSCASYTYSKKYGTYIDGPEYETIGMLGSNCCIADIEDIQHLNYLCDNYGMDTISAGGTIAFTMECIEKGVITPGDLGGINLEFGNAEAVKEILTKIAYRDGPGNLLAEGSRAMAEKVGYFSNDFAIQVKGMELSAYECRGAPGMLLAYMTSDTGAQHTRSWTIVSDLEMGRATIDGRAELVMHQQIQRSLMEMFGVCRFPWVETKLDFTEYIRALNAVTGIGYSQEDLFRISERVWNLTRAFWAREVSDFGRSYDLPPARFYEPMRSGPTKGLHLTEERVNQMLDEYYGLCGWDDNGIPTETKLRELGLGKVAEELRKLGKLS